MPTNPSTNHLLSFIDESDAYSIIDNFIDGKRHIFIIDFDKNQFDIDLALNIIKTIHCYYKIDNVIHNNTLHKLLDIKISRDILPKILERTNIEEVLTKLISIKICDHSFINDISLEKSIDEYYENNKEILDKYYNNINDIMPAVKLAMKSIKIGKICTSKDK